MPEPTIEQVKTTPDISAYKIPLEKTKKEVRILTPEVSASQEEVLRWLPPIDDLVERLYGHLRTRTIEGNDVSEINLGGVVAGELAEILVAAEYSQVPVVVDGKEMPRSTELTDINTSERLLGVLRNPNVLNLASEVRRNPDLAWLDTENRVVKMLGEVKITKQLDQRCFYQLRPSGFIENVRRTVEVLNADPKSGKEVFGADPSTGEALKGRVASDVREIVFLPRDTDISEANWDKLILRKKSPDDKQDKGLYAHQADEFLELMRSGKVRLTTFSFSRAEIAELSRELSARILARYPQITARFG